MGYALNESVASIFIPFSFITTSPPALLISDCSAGFLPMTRYMPFSGPLILSLAPIAEANGDFTATSFIATLISLSAQRNAY